MPSKKQIAQRKKFKAKAKQAKTIQARHQNMKYTTAVKIAWGKQKGAKMQES